MNVRSFVIVSKVLKLFFVFVFLPVYFPFVVQNELFCGFFFSQVHHFFLLPSHFFIELIHCISLKISVIVFFSSKISIWFFFIATIYLLKLFFHHFKQVCNCSLKPFVMAALNSCHRILTPVLS